MVNAALDVDKASRPALRVMGRFLATQRLRVGGAIVAGILTILSSVALLAVSAWLIERASQRPPILSLMVAIVAVRFFGIGRGVFRYVDRFLSHDASFRLLGAVRSEAYQALIPLAPAGLERFGHGEVLARVAADVDQMQDWFVRGFAPVCISAITLLLVAAGAAAILPAAGAATLIALLVAALSISASVRMSGRVAEEEMLLRGRVSAATVGYIQGLADLVALGGAEEMVNGIESTERARDRLAARRALRVAVAAGLQAALPGLLAAVIGVIVAANFGAVDPLMIGVLVFGGMAAAECTAALPGAVQAWERGLAAARRLAEVESLPQPVPVRGTRSLDRPPHMLTVRDLSFRYAESFPWVLDRVSLQVSVGERVVIVGPSGAGKSTLASLLLRFLAPDSGEIELDGVNVAELGEASVRSALGAAMQHAHLFTGTIRDNILLARPTATDAELHAAVANAQLAGWIERLPEGWNTEVGERGIAVSGGQRRRIALARALLAGFPFLIADEPTEGLDDATARSLTEALWAAGSRHALIVITHRPDLCPAADAVYELTRGRLRPAPVSTVA